MEGEAPECWGDPAQPGKWGPCWGWCPFQRMVWTSCPLLGPLPCFPTAAPVWYAPLSLLPSLSHSAVLSLSFLLFTLLSLTFLYFPSSLCFCPSPCLHLSRCLRVCPSFSFSLLSEAPLRESLFSVFSLLSCTSVRLPSCLFLSLPLLLSATLPGLSVCPFLPVPPPCRPSLPPSLPACPSCLFLAGPRPSVSPSPCLSLPLLSGKAVIYELRTGPAAGAGGPDYSFPEEAACSGMAG